MRPELDNIRGVTRHIVLCAVLGACGFGPGARATTDGAVSDAVTDGPGGGSDGGSDDGSSGAMGCFPQWLDHTVSISPSTVDEISELSSAGNDRNPWLSDNGLRMYFSREPGDANTSDIYFTARASIAQPFVTPTAYTNLNSTAREGRAFVTSDELTLVLSTNRDGPLNIYMNTRVAPAVFGTPDGTYMTMVNSVGTQRNDPSISADRLRLYLAADNGPAGKLQLLIATRSSVTENFSAPSVIPGTVDNANHQGDPTLYSGERLLVFSSFPLVVGNADVWYATRASATESFGPPVRIPAVNTGAVEFDPVLSADGCEVYFASTRRGGAFHLFHAQVTK